MSAFLTCGTFCWSSVESGSTSGEGEVLSGSLFSVVEGSRLGQGLPGMMPADLAARSMAPERKTNNLKCPQDP